MMLSTAKATTDVEQDAEKWKSSDDVQRHGDITTREDQIAIDPAVEKRVVRK